MVPWYKDEMGMGNRSKTQLYAKASEQQKTKMVAPIAIVGVSFELPSGSYSTENLDHQSFFNFLLSSGEAYESLPSGRFNVEAWKGDGIGKISVDKGSFLKDIDTFDNVEFGISSRDARSMAPSARRLLENSFLALLDSGIDYRMKNIGVFTSGTSIELSNVSEPDEFDARGSFAGYPSMVANRISNHLDLLEPSLPLDTACSSTLTAMHLAVQAILSDDCDAAVVGGCQLNHRFIDWVTYSQGSLLAKDGKCKPFDSHADGFARAEGCAVVVVKPLEAALMDNDHIYATILGTAINSTGAAAAPGAPVGESQRDAMYQAFERAGRSPRQVDFVELHATGTAKGDPTEANWVGEHFHREDELLVGSVKGNIGHTEITAFLASLSKVISILEKKIIPPQVNVIELNPAIKWDEYRLKLPMESTPLPCRSGNKSLVSIAGSGIGGSNGHVVLESPPPIVTRPVNVSDEKRPHLIMAGGLSSRSAESLSRSIREDFGRFSSDLPGLSTILGRRSKQATWRSYTISGVDQTSLPDFTTAQHCARIPNSLVYIFSGQGPQHKDMGRELFRSYPVFRESILEMDHVFSKVTGMSIIHNYGLFGDSTTAHPLPDIWPIALVLPSIAIFQIALFDLLKSFGLVPDAIVGHSAGETAVLYASGAAPKEMAVELAIIRGRCFTPIEELRGTMAAISCNPGELDDMLREHRKLGEGGIVELACFNAPAAVAIAGEESAIVGVLKIAEDRGKFARKIRTRVPFHSSMMEKAEETYTSALRALFDRYPGTCRPKIPVYSTLTGRRFDAAFDADYFWNNTVSPVRFLQAMEVIRHAIPSASFVEIAPHPVLSSYVVSMASKSSIALHSLQRPKRGQPSTELVDVLHLCGKLSVAGHNSIDFHVLINRFCSEFDLELPAYPFSKKRYPLYPDSAGVRKQMDASLGPLNSSYLRMNKETHPTLAEHVIRGEPIMPAAGYLEMALEFGATTLMDVNMRSILSLSSDKPVKVEVKLDGAYWSVKSFAESKALNEYGVKLNERLHADGYLSFEIPAAVAPLDLAAIRSRCLNHVGSEFYPSLSYFSAYGPPFQRVTNMSFNDHEAIASIKGLDSRLLKQVKDAKYLLHPAIVDACLQVSAYKAFHGDFDPNIYYLPARIDALIVHQTLRPYYFPRHIYAHVELKNWIPDAMCYDITLVDDSGIRLCSLIGFRVAKHRINPLTDVTRPLDIVLQPIFHNERCIPKALYQPTDRSELFGTLDKLSIRNKVRQKMGASNDSFGSPKGRLGRIDQDWSTYFSAFGAHEITPSSDGPQFDEAIKCTMHSLQSALEDLATEGVQVVHCLIVSNVKTDEFNKAIEKTFDGFPALYADLYCDNKHPSRMLPKVLTGVVRSVKTTFTASGLQGLEEQYFDVVVFFNVTGDEAAPRSIAKAANQLLVPGGTFIVTERNLDGWDLCSLGTMWYDTTFGPPNTTNTYPSSSYVNCLKAQGITTLRLHNSQECDPFHFSLECQKKPWPATHAPKSPLFNPEEDFFFEYAFGSEMDLQWELSGLNDGQRLNVWITTSHGKDGGAAQGLVRVLRREYSSWTIRLLIFPSSYDVDMRQGLLECLPAEVAAEEDIIVSTACPHRLLVPRLAPVRDLPGSDANNNARATAAPPKVPVTHVLLRPLSTSLQGDVSGILAIVVDGHSTELQEGALVIGLTAAPIDEFIVMDVAALFALPTEFKEQAALLPSFVPGFVAMALGIGLSTFTRYSRLKALRILLTHCDTPIGSCILTFLVQHGIQPRCLPQSANLSNLAKFQHEPYDLILSGYTEHPYRQVMETILESQRGRLFLWNHEKEGLVGILRKDPCAIGDALQCAMSTMAPYMAEVHLPEVMDLTDATPRTHHESRPNLLRHATFDEGKTYLLLGGIGSLGAHLALFMYQRGVRKIVLTSRSGERSLKSNSNVVIRRMFSYLQSRDDLQLSFKALDGTDALGMKSLIAEVGASQIGGCILLTAVLSDGVFRHLIDEDFAIVFAAKDGVLRTLKEAIDLQSMDFLISFTSMSGVIGSGGQTNYGAANTSLEHEMEALSNGFAFVCPGILDSSLLLAGADKHKEALMSHFLSWSISAEDMIGWFEDALYRFQHAQRIVRYFPCLDWEALDRSLGMPVLGKHLLPSQVGVENADIDGTTRMADIIRNVLAVPSADFSATVPFTAYGIDSLSASRISFFLRPFVEVSQIQLLGDLSLNDIQRLAQKTDEPMNQVVADRKPQVTKTHAELMIDMLAKYSHGMRAGPLQSPSSSAPSSLGEVILITGTTGTLGSNILSRLLQTTQIQQIYAINRSKESGVHARQRAAFIRQGLDVSLLDSTKLVLLEADLTLSDFGLGAYVSEKLLSSVTYIIHNAWTVDFATSLPAYENLVKGTRKLIDFAQRSLLPSPPSLSYVSTIGVYQDAKADSRGIFGQEVPILDPRLSVQTGYIESKWVAERLFNLAAKRCCLQTNVIRVGLLTGGVNGSWDPSQWLPGIVQSAVYLGCLPESDDTVSWIPVEMASAAIVDLRTISSDDTLHVIHPTPTTWNAIMQPLSTILNVPLVPYAEWFARLESSARDEDDGPSTLSIKHAALKLVAFYRLGLNGSRTLSESHGLLTRVASEKGRNASPTLQLQLPPLGEEDVKKWVSHWKEIGFLPS